MRARSCGYYRCCQLCAPHYRLADPRSSSLVPGRVPSDIALQPSPSRLSSSSCQSPSYPPFVFVLPVCVHAAPTAVGQFLTCQPVTGPWSCMPPLSSRRLLSSWPFVDSQVPWSLVLVMLLLLLLPRTHPVHCCCCSPSCCRHRGLLSSLLSLVVMPLHIIVLSLCRSYVSVIAVVGERGGDDGGRASKDRI
jgi:hypothetical protein